MNPFVSVIVAVYNKAAYIRETLNCITNQTLKNVEIILIDDGSTDSSCTILKEYREKDSRIVLIEQKNTGPGSARNAGLAIAKGKYLAFLDADDLYDLNMLDEMYRKAENENCDIVVCDYQRLDDSTGNILPGGNGLNYKEIHHCNTYNPQNLAKYIFQTHILWAWDKLFKRDFVMRYSHVFPPLHNSEDAVFTAPLVISAERIGIVKKIFITYRINIFTSVSNMRSGSVHDYAKAILLIRDFMVKYNLYNLYEQSFINWSLEFSFWNMNAYLDRPIIDDNIADSFMDVYNYNKAVFFREIGIDKYQESYFYNNNSFQEYKKIASMSFRPYILRRMMDYYYIGIGQQFSSRSCKIEKIITWFSRKVYGFLKRQYHLLRKIVKKEHNIIPPPP